MNYSKHYPTSKKNRTNTPQTKAIPGREDDMVKNSHKCYTFEIDKWESLRRFLIIGTAGGTFYASENKSTSDNIKLIEACIKENSGKVLDELVTISSEGLAHKNDPAIFTLALVLTLGDDISKRRVVDVYSKVIRTGTHHFTFISYINDLRGWGRIVKRTVSGWYNKQAPDRLAYQLAKYQRRGGWSHNDALRLCHANPATPEHDLLFKWATNKDITYPCGMNYIDGLQKAKEAKTAKALIKVIEEHRLTREMIPTEYLKDLGVWEVLLKNTPLTALIRNLGNLSQMGYLIQGKWTRIESVCSKITNEEYIHKSRVHPISILFALKTYASGQGFRGKGQWTPVQEVVDALNNAFYLSFKNVEPTGKRYMLGLDVSSSMTFNYVPNTNIAASEIAGAMAMVTDKIEKRTIIKGFSNRFIDLPISNKQRLDSVIKTIYGRTFGSTDCSLPMEWALKNDAEVDVFVVYTDNETNTGRRHPVQALNAYRKASGIPAKLIVAGTCANKFSIADPKDKGMLDIVGFSADTPQAINAFVAEQM